MRARDAAALHDATRGAAAARGVLDVHVHVHVRGRRLAVARDQFQLLTRRVTLNQIVLAFLPD